MSALIPSDRAPGLHVAPGVEVPDDAEIAPHVTIYAGVQIGPRAVLGQGCILGRPQQIDARSRTPRQPAGAETVLGAGVRVGSATVVVAGSRLGDGAYLGDLVLIRETAIIGRETMVGRGVGIGHSTSVGDRVRIQVYSQLGPYTVLEEEVFLGARVTLVSDPTMGRRAPGPPNRGILVRRGARIGTAAIILPPVDIGDEAVVGAGALVRSDVPPRMVVAGVPAVPLRRVRDDELIDEWTT